MSEALILLAHEKCPLQANPAQFGHCDWYPSRYQGSDDYGGVHSNSGTDTDCWIGRS
jgi:hypothetical protein